MTDHLRAAPRLVVVFDFEATRPSVVADYLEAGDAERMADWLGSQPRLLDLLERAVELASEERAA